MTERAIIKVRGDCTGRPALWVQLGPIVLFDRVAWRGPRYATMAGHSEVILRTLMVRHPWIVEYEFMSAEMWPHPDLMPDRFSDVITVTMYKMRRKLKPMGVDLRRRARFGISMTLKEI